MAEKPILIFPNPTVVAWPKKPPGGGGSNYHFPEVDRQKDRLTTTFETMNELFVTNSETGIEPEKVLVIETIGEIDDFARAVRNVEGLEWLAEVDADEIEPDKDFFEKPKIPKKLFYDNIEELNTAQSSQIWDTLKRESFIDKNGFLTGKNLKDFIPFVPENLKQFEQEIASVLKITSKPIKLLKQRLFLCMSNKQAMKQLLSLWNQWDSQRRLPLGKQKWSDIFSLLKVIRPWNVVDRLYETSVLEYWKENLKFYQDEGSLVPFEVELWYRGDVSKRQEAITKISHLIQTENGRVVATCTIEDIRFCAVKAELPAEKIQNIIDSQYIELFKCDEVMFFRPTGQCAVEVLPEGELGEFVAGETSGEPIVAILDGHPFPNHDLLSNRLIIDDPDDFNNDYHQPKEYQHGTAMASLICHGELDASEQPLIRPVYIRPIMKPSDNHIDRHEFIPEDQFIEDLIERSLRRMFESIGAESPIAPTIKIINISIGDPSKMFFHSLSSCARLLDWLSCKYNVLFCVSGGNILDDISLGINEEEISDLSNEEISTQTLKILHKNNRNRRILSPAESINSLTIGSMNSDKSNTEKGNRIDILPIELLPSPTTSHGYGFRASIKPEIYLSGGKTFHSYIENGIYTINDSPLGPGQKVATVPVRPGETSRTVYCGGTSNSAALASRSAALIFESLLELENQFDYSFPEENIAVILKSLLVHSASWGSSKEVLEELLEDGINRTTLSRYLGYGVPNIERVLECTQQRATAIGYGQLRKKERHEFRLPIPPSLSGVNDARRLTITLAWFSPINPSNRKFRKAKLSFSPPKEEIAEQRQEADHNQVKRGTVQHEILQGSKIVSYQDGEFLIIPVECREDAGILDETVNYGLAVTLEVKEGIDIPIYEEIKQRIGVPITVQG